MTTESSLNDALANAVQTARAGTVRVAAGRCGSTSGTVIGEELVATSSAALRGAEDVKLFDDAGQERKAELVGHDPGTEIALIRSPGAGFAKPTFVDPNTLRVAELAIALGRPGVAIRASLRIIGLLSGELRTPRGGKLDRYIESDRGLPDGFAGGPLVNVRGELIGMNTSALLRGSDLAIPQATLERVAAELTAHGRVRRGYLGVATQAVRLPAALRDQLSQRSGALVLDTDEHGPARAAGLALGDVIVALDQIPIRTPHELSAALSDKIGASVSLKIARGGQLQSVTITVGERG